MSVSNMLTGVVPDLFVKNSPERESAPKKELCTSLSDFENRYAYISIANYNTTSKGFQGDVRQ